MAYVYEHRTKDTKEIFYVGIGTSAEYARAYRKRGRSSFWDRVSKKHGLTVVITHKDVIWEEACSIEKYLISFYGRRNNNTGILVNMTDGGEGVSGIVVSNETKEKLRQANIGKLQSDETKAKRRDLMLGNQRNLGKKASIETIEKLRIACANNNKGNKQTEEQRHKNSLLHKGKKISASHIEALRKSNIGRKKSDDTLDKLRESIKKHWDKRRGGMQ